MFIANHFVYIYKSELRAVLSRTITPTGSALAKVVEKCYNSGSPQLQFVTLPDLDTPLKTPQFL